MGEALNLAILLTLKDAASAGLSSIGSKLGGVGKVAAGLAGAAVAGVGALGAALWDAGKAAAEEEVGVARLGAAVTASGADWATAQAGIESYLAAQTARVALDDGEGRDALTRLTTTTGDYKKAMDLLPLAIDLAAAKQIPLATAAELVGKVAEGNTGVLSRYGIVLGEGATATDALAAMQQKFAGQGEAFAGTFEGQQQRMGIALGNLKETIGGLVLPIMTKLAEGAADLATRALPSIEAGITKVQPFFTWLGDTINVIAGYVSSFIGGVRTGSGQFGEAMTIIQNVANAVLPFVRELIGQVTAFFAEKFGFIKGWIDSNMPLIQQTIDTVLNAIRAAWEFIWPLLQTILEGVWNNMKIVVDGAINAVLSIIKAVMQAINGDWSGAWDTIKGYFVSIWDTIKQLLTNTLNTILGLFGTDLDTMLGKVRTWVGNVDTSITTFFTSLPGKFTGWLNGVIGSIETFAGKAVSAIESPFQTAYDWLTGLWGQIKDFIAHIFDGVHIPTPHFSLRTETQNILGIDVPVPKINVDWYGSGLDAVFANPTLIGVGESGAERVTVTPLRGSGGSASSGATYNLTYVDQRPGGGAADLLGVARRLEWQARMGL